MNNKISNENQERGSLTPPWMEVIRKVRDEIITEQKKSVTINPQHSLYSIFFRRLLKVKEDYKREITPFPVVFEKLCLLFSITKKECWEVLFTLRDAGWIEVVPYHGIKIPKNGNQQNS